MDTRDYLRTLYSTAAGDPAEGWAVAMQKQDERVANLGVFRMPGDLETMVATLARAGRFRDVYNSVYLFGRPRRLAPYALASPWLYLEVDDDSQGWRGVEPTLTVSSSPGRYHHYFKCDRDIEPDERRRLLIAMVSEGEGDPAAKDLSRVLRPAGSWSHKRGAPVEAVGGSGAVYTVGEVIGERNIPAPPAKGKAADSTDLAAWLAANDVEATPKSDELGVKYAVACPWESSHSTPGGAYVGKIEGGGLWYWCPHASCSHRKWRDYHDHYAPAVGFGKLAIGGRRV